MSSCDFTEPHRPNYFTDFFEKGFIFPAVLIASLIASFLAMFFQFGFWGQMASEKAKALFVICCVFYFAIILVYMVLCIQNPKVGSNDCFNFAFVIAGLFYLGYVVISRGKMLTLSNIIIGSALLIAGVTITLIRSALFDFYDEQEFVGNKFQTYFYEVFKKFNFITILLFSILFNCIFYIGFNLKLNVQTLLVKNGYKPTANLFSNAILSVAKSNPLYLILLVIGVLCVGAYVVLTAKKSLLNIIDLAVVSFVFNLPLMLFTLLLMGNNIKNFIIAILAIIVFGVLFFIRLDAYKKENYEKKYLVFLDNIFKNKDSLGVVGVATLIVAFSNSVTKLGILSYCVVDKKLNIYVELLPLAFVCSACIFIFIWFGIGLIKDIFDLDNKNVSKFDIYLLPNFAFAFFNFLTVFTYSKISVTNIVISISYMIISFGIGFARKQCVK